MSRTRASATSRRFMGRPQGGQSLPAARLLVKTHLRLRSNWERERPICSAWLGSACPGFTYAELRGPHFPKLLLKWGAAKRTERFFESGLQEVTRNGSSTDA